MLQIKLPSLRRRTGTTPQPDLSASHTAGTPREPIQGMAGTDTRDPSVIGWCIAAIGLGILIFAVPSAPADQRFAALMTSAGFLGLGLFIVVACAYYPAQRRKFGVSHMHLEAPPPRVAGTLAGRLVIPSGLGPLDTVRLRLECRRSTRVRGASSEFGRGAYDVESVWLGEQRISVRLGPHGETDLPFTFRIPPGLPATLQGDPRIEWRILAAAAVPGMDYSDQFDLHVGPDTHLAAGESPAALDPPVLPVNTPVAPGLGTAPHADGAISLYRIEADRRTGPFWPGWPGIGWLPFGLAGLLSLLPPWARASRPLAMALTALGLATFAPLFVDPPGVAGLGRWGIEPLDTLIRVTALSSLVLGVTWATALILRSWHKEAHLERYGISFLRLQSWPVLPGGMAQGVLEVPRQLTPRGGFAFRLLCVRTRWFQRWVPGPAVATAWTGKWSAFQGYHPGNGQTEVPFELSVPLDPPESGLTEGSWQWYVETRARPPGVNYVSRFIVPVRCSQTSPTSS